MPTIAIEIIPFTSKCVNSTINSNAFSFSPVLLLFLCAQKVIMAAFTGRTDG